MNKNASHPDRSECGDLSNRYMVESEVNPVARVFNQVMLFESRFLESTCIVFLSWHLIYLHEFTLGFWLRLDLSFCRSLLFLG